MSDIKKIDTNLYVKEGKVEIDGKVWSIKLPGAGTELRMSKVQRRTALLSKKVENGTATEDDLDRLDELEDEFYLFFISIFDDGKGGAEVKEWADSTPLAIIQKAFEDIKEQAN